MYFNEPLPFLSEFIEKVSDGLALEGHACLSHKQQEWLSFCMMGILSSNTVCWKENERNSLGLYKSNAQSWMFRHSSISWEKLFLEGIRQTIQEFNITTGSLVIDETDRARSKSTRKIYHLHTLKDKKTGGTVPGQCIVLLFLVTPSVSIPVGFEFYMPDPERTKWRKEYNRLKKEGVVAKKRPKEPTRRAKYPTKQEIGIKLLQNFKADFPTIKVSSVNADALYGVKTFLEEAEKIYPQVISQVRGDQKIIIRGVEKSIKAYFSSCTPVETTITIRGSQTQKISFISAR